MEENKKKQALSEEELQAVNGGKIIERPDADPNAVLNQSLKARISGDVQEEK